MALSPQLFPPRVCITHRADLQQGGQQVEALLAERRAAVKAEAGGGEALAQRALGVLAQVELAGIGQLGQACGREGTREDRSGMRSKAQHADVCDSRCRCR